MPPLIGLTAQPSLMRSAAGEIPFHVLAHTYTDAVARAGGVPVLLAPVPADRIDAILDRMDGLVLTGGGDVDPQRYGEDPVPSVHGVDARRDEFELELARRARQRRTPMLAICRGLQVLNVALGGSLIQDIAGNGTGEPHHRAGHGVYHGHQPVRLEAGCRIAGIVGETDLMVNSIHHQAVRRLAPGLRAVGWAGDGVVEAVEHEDGGWPLLAVQWHPEYLGHADDAASAALFSALVASARAASDR